MSSSQAKFQNGEGAWITLKLQSVVACWERERHFSLGMCVSPLVRHTPVDGCTTEGIWTVQSGLDGLQIMKQSCMDKKGR